MQMATGRWAWHWWGHQNRCLCPTYCSLLGFFSLWSKNNSVFRQTFRRQTGFVTTMRVLPALTVQNHFGDCCWTRSHAYGKTNPSQHGAILPLWRIYTGISPFSIHVLKDTGSKSYRWNFNLWSVHSVYFVTVGAVCTYSGWMLL